MIGFVTLSPRGEALRATDGRLAFFRRNTRARSGLFLLGGPLPSGPRRRLCQPARLFFPCALSKRESNPKRWTRRRCSLQKRRRGEISVPPPPSAATERRNGTGLTCAPNLTAGTESSSWSWEPARLRVSEGFSEALWQERTFFFGREKLRLLPARNCCLPGREHFNTEVFGLRKLPIPPPRREAFGSSLPRKIANSHGTAPLTRSMRFFLPVSTRLGQGGGGSSPAAEEFLSEESLSSGALGGKPRRIDYAIVDVTGGEAGALLDVFGEARRCSENFPGFAALCVRAKSGIVAYFQGEATSLGEHRRRRAREPGGATEVVTESSLVHFAFGKGTAYLRLEPKGRFRGFVTAPLARSELERVVPTSPESVPGRSGGSSAKAQATGSSPRQKPREKAERDRAGAREKSRPRQGQRVA